MAPTRSRGPVNVAFDDSESPHHAKIPRTDKSDNGLLPTPDDNAAIAVRTIDPGEPLRLGGKVLCASSENRILEGHRFATEDVKEGGQLYSWGLPFGTATRDICAGDYLCNEGTLGVLKTRGVKSGLPDSANFTDVFCPSYKIDDAKFSPGPPTEVNTTCPEEERTFWGYPRGDVRGTGTRSFLVVLGVSSLTASYVRALETRIRPIASKLMESTGANKEQTLHGVVGIAHTEGAGAATPRNRALLLRTLAGFAVHPNVAAVLLVQQGGAAEAVGAEDVLEYMRAAPDSYPVDESPPRDVLTMSGDFSADLERGEATLRRWLEARAGQVPRCLCPVAGLRVALQCGGSDAFSGISGNPLVAWVAREVIQRGGAALLAETDELIGAEGYVLGKVRDRATADAFLHTVERFKAYAREFGQSADGNPSVGNQYRGLYNIALKSAGAAIKRPADVRLEGCLDYSQRLPAAASGGWGFWFMDSPGNDIESIAGQVASGCNLVSFTTGNGSITNFPFVPTIKVMTTTARFHLLSGDIDINAGRYLDGESMADLGRDSLNLFLRVASGQLSAGERARHHQVSIWRDWGGAAADPAGGPAAPEAASPAAPAPSPGPLAVKPCGRRGGGPALAAGAPGSRARVALVLPTSLCSGQIARQIAEGLDAGLCGGGALDGPGRRAAAAARCVALPHTEGCGVAAGGGEDVRVLCGHLRSPLVAAAVLLEHGCEKLHNGVLAEEAARQGLAPEQFGWLSVQLDGGIAEVSRKAKEYLEARLTAATAPPRPPPPPGGPTLTVALASLAPPGAVSRELHLAAAEVVRRVLAVEGAAVVLGGRLAEAPDFLDELLVPTAAGKPVPTLRYGEWAGEAGLHLMAGASGSPHWAELLTGLGAAGPAAGLAIAHHHTLQGHPLVPFLMVTEEGGSLGEHTADMDLVLAKGAGEGCHVEWADRLVGALAEVLEGGRVPKNMLTGNVDFQIGRGRNQVSL